MKKVFVLVLAVLALAGLAACGSKSGRSGTDAELIGVFVTAEPEMPEGKEYRIGDRLDLTGLELTAVYADGRRETLSNDDIVVDEPDTFKTAGRKRITVTPKEESLAEGGRKTAYFFVDVASGKGIKSARITKEPKKEYVIGDKLDLTDIEVTVTYDDGRENEIFGADAFDFAQKEFVEAGKVTVSLMIDDYEVPLEVTVKEKTEDPNAETTPDAPVDSKPYITGIEVTQGSLKKKEYFVHDTFDPTGLTLTASMSDGTQQTITSGFRCTVGESDSNVFSKTGEEIRVKISYTDPLTSEPFSTDLNVTVKEKLTSVKIKATDGAKVGYRPGEEFDMTGFLLTLHYDDGSTKGRDEDISKDFELTPDPFDTEGTKTVKASYTDPDTKKVFTDDSFTVTVTKAKLTGITVATGPTAKDYKVGDKFDPAGLSLTAAYDDGNMPTIETGFICTVEDTDSDEFVTAGSSVKVKVTYSGQETSFTVRVFQLTEIKITQLPATATYDVGDKFDPKGLSLTATYSDGSTERKETLTEGFACSPRQFDEAGKKTVTVTYEDGSVEKTDSFEVTVLKLTGIEANTDKVDKDYYVDDEFNPAGLTLTAYYQDNDDTPTATDKRTVTDTNAFTCKAESFAAPGTKKVTVEYKDKTVTAW